MKHSLPLVAIALPLLAFGCSAGPRDPSPQPGSSPASIGAVEQPLLLPSGGYPSPGGLDGGSAFPIPSGNLPALPDAGLLLQIPDAQFPVLPAPPDGGYALPDGGFSPGVPDAAFSLPDGDFFVALPDAALSPPDGAFEFEIPDSSYSPPELDCGFEAPDGAPPPVAQPSVPAADGG